MRQRICAVNDFLTERLVTSLRIVKRRGENQPAAIAVLAVSFVALHGQTHRDVMQLGKLVLGDVCRAEVGFVRRVDGASADGEDERQRSGQQRRQLCALFKERRNQAGDRGDDRRKADLCAEKRADREQRAQSSAFLSLPASRALRNAKTIIGANATENASVYNSEVQ